MKFAHIKKGMLVLLAMAIVSTLPACGRKESTPPADGGPADAQTVSVNSAVNRLVASNDALYTIIGDELVRFRPSDRRAETVGYLSKLTGAPAEGSMLFQSDGRLWLLWTAHRDGGASGEVQLAPLNAAAGALEEPNYTLPGWPDAAAFYGEQFFSAGSQTRPMVRLRCINWISPVVRFRLSIQILFLKSFQDRRTFCTPQLR